MSIKRMEPLELQGIQQITPTMWTGFVHAPASHDVQEYTLPIVVPKMGSPEPAAIFCQARQINPSIDPSHVRHDQFAITVTNRTRTSIDLLIRRVDQATGTGAKTRIDVLVIDSPARGA